jgi:hypothetical protein
LAGIGRNRQVFRDDQPAIGQDGRAFEHVPQFADVAGPVIIDQRAPCILRDAAGRASQRLGKVREERVAQRHDVVATIPQWGQLDRKDVQPVEQIFAELFALYRVLEIVSVEPTCAACVSTCRQLSDLPITR